MDHDRVDGTGKKITGSIKESIGKLMGNKKIRAEGKAENTAGRAQDGFGSAKDSVRGSAGK